MRKYTKNIILISESAEQQNLFRWAEFQSAKTPELCLMYHIPNEGKRSLATGGRLKAEGLKSGVPDVCLPVPRGNYHGLYIEMKAGKNKPTENQLQWLHDLTMQGYVTAVCYSFEAAKDTIMEYLYPNTPNTRDTHLPQDTAALAGEGGRHEHS